MEIQRDQPARSHQRHSDLNNIQVSDAGSYTVEVTDATGTYLSNPCLVKVFDKPVITQQPQSLTVVDGRTATFTVTAAAPPPSDTSGGSTARPGRSKPTPPSASPMLRPTTTASTTWWSAMTLVR